MVEQLNQGGENKEQTTPNKKTLRRIHKSILTLNETEG